MDGAVSTMTSGQDKTLALDGIVHQLGTSDSHVGAHWIGCKGFLNESARAYFCRSTSKHDSDQNCFKLCIKYEDLLQIL
jgi:hypothetical protein